MMMQVRFTCRVCQYEKVAGIVVEPDETKKSAAYTFAEREKQAHLHPESSLTTKWRYSWEGHITS